MHLYICSFLKIKNKFFSLIYLEPISSLPARQFEEYRARRVLFIADLVLLEVREELLNQRLSQYMTPAERELTHDMIHNVRLMIVRGQEKLRMMERETKPFVKNMESLMIVERRDAEKKLFKTVNNKFRYISFDICFD